MYMSTEDARSDFVLAAAAAVFGPAVSDLVASLPFYPNTGVPAQVLGYLWIVLFAVAVPWGLVSYRDQGVAGLGITGERSAATTGLLVAAPIAAVWLLRAADAGIVVDALLGRLTFPALGGDRSVTDSAVVDLLLRVTRVTVYAAGTVALFGLLTTRAREGFRRTDIKLVEGLRSFGMGAAAGAAVLGLLVAISPTYRLLDVALTVGGLVAMVLLADRVVHPAMGTSRATLLAPAIVALVMQLFVGPGGGLLGSLYSGVVSGGVVIVLAALFETRRHAWAALPVAVVGALYPTCLTGLLWASVC